MTNYWQFLNVTKVEVNPTIGTRLHFFPEHEDSIFENVIITYIIYINNSLVSQTRILNLSSSGQGETMPCIIIFPRITNISGVVEYRI